MRYTVLLFFLTIGVFSMFAKSFEINSFTPQPFDLTASTKQKLDLNGIPGALVKIPIPDDIKELNIEGNLIEQTFDGSEVHAYLTSGTKSILIKCNGWAPCLVIFSDYGVYRLLSKQVYVLDLRPLLSAKSTAKEIDSRNRIYDLLDSSSGEDPIDRMVNEANDLYSNGKVDDAIPLLKKAASLGHAEALLSLGLLYENGVKDNKQWILEPSPYEAFRNVQASAQQGYAPAQKTLYRYYLTGVWETADKTMADAWKAAYDKNVNGQDIPDSEEVFIAVEIPAEYPGGIKKLFQDLNNVLRYPESAQVSNIQGRIMLRFVVQKDGSIGNIEVARSSCYYTKETVNSKGKYITEKITLPNGDKDLEKAAIIAVGKLGKFYPGRCNGTPVRSYFNLPITFNLSTQ